MPQLSDLRESGAIEQDADSVLFLMRPEYYGMLEPIEVSGTEYPTKNLAIGIIAKNRHGATKNIAMHFTGNTMQFKNHEFSMPIFKKVELPNTQQLKQDDLPF